MKKPTELKIKTAIIIISLALLSKLILFGLAAMLLINVFDTSLAFEDNSIASIVNIVSSLVIDFLIIVIIFPWFKVSVTKQFGKVKFISLITFSILAVFVMLLIQPIINPIDFFEKLGQNILVIKKMNFVVFDNPTIIGYSYFILMAFMTPVIEEVVYRGFIFNTLLKNYSFKISLIASSLIFAFAHLRFAGFVYLFIYGLFFGYAYYKTKSLFVPILAHTVINFIAQLSSPLFVEINSEIIVKYILIYLVNLFLIFITLSFLNKQNFETQKY